MPYIYENSGWPNFTWQEKPVHDLLLALRHRQGRVLGRMEGLGFELQAEAQLQALTLEVVKSTEIEGEILSTDQVRSSLARRLGMDIPGLVPADRHIDGVVEMMLDATQRFDQRLTKERLFGWQAALFPTGYSGMYRINVGSWRKKEGDPMQVVSGPMGRETVHYQAPPAETLETEMDAFLNWLESGRMQDPVLKAAIAHLWFVTLHPFDDGNGRIARAITDLQLARADGSPARFYSMSAQIRKERKTYYEMLERTQKGPLDITPWIKWFLECLERALAATDEILAHVLAKARFWNTHGTTALNERQIKLLNRLLDGFEGKLTSGKWAKIARCSPDTALRDIQDLLSKGILVKETSGGRSTGYLINNPVQSR